MELSEYTIDSIESFNGLYGFETYNRLVSVFDMSAKTRTANHKKLTYGIFAIFLKQGIDCSLHYGMQSYDYKEGTVVSFSPGQTIEVDMTAPATKSKSKGLVFHPDLIYGTTLHDKIAEFKFFDFTDREALHLSLEERNRFLSILSAIETESHHQPDTHSAALISGQITILLEYLHRFYDRQFNTRHQANSRVVATFERSLRNYYSGVPDKRLELPSVSLFARQAGLSAGYFGEMVKRETGHAAKDLIANHVANVAKHRLSGSSADVSEIAYSLGFDYPAHFTRLFKRITGLSPTDFRKSLKN